MEWKLEASYEMAVLLRGRAHALGWTKVLVEMEIQTQAKSLYCVPPLEAELAEEVKEVTGDWASHTTVKATPRSNRSALYGCFEAFVSHDGAH